MNTVLLEADARPSPQRVYLPPEELDINREQLFQLWQAQDKYIDMLELRVTELAKDSEEKNKPVDTSRRENLLVMRLTAKEQELQEMAGQIAELKSLQSPSTQQLRSSLLDPAVNLIIQKLKKECDNLRKQMEEAQNELSAWKFTPDSATGKRLMAKCRQLYQENEDLGKMIASGRLAKLEGELALQKNLTEEMKKNQLEMDEFMTELDEDVEGMQSTIYYLQQQLREAKEKIAELEQKLAEQEEKPKAEKPKAEVKPDLKPESSEEPRDPNGQRLSLGWSGSVEENIGVKEEEDDEEKDNTDVEPETADDKAVKVETDKLDSKNNEAESKPEKRTSGRTESPAEKSEIETQGGRREADSPGGKRGRGRGRRRGQDRNEEIEEEDNSRSGRGKRKRVERGGGRTPSKRNNRRTESECSDGQNDDGAD